MTFRTAYILFSAEIKIYLQCIFSYHKELSSPDFLLSYKLCALYFLCTLIVVFIVYFADIKSCFHCILCNHKELISLFFDCIFVMYFELFLKNCGDFVILITFYFLAKWIIRSQSIFQGKKCKNFAWGERKCNYSLCHGTTSNVKETLMNATKEVSYYIPLFDEKKNQMSQMDLRHCTRNEVFREGFPQ